MPMRSKRALSTTTRSISPPAVRRKLSQSLEVRVVSDTKHPCVEIQSTRIFSWNVNGVGPLLQKNLSFQPGSVLLSPLRVFLRRHRWPQFLCLQEVKIATKDAATQRLVQVAANHGAASNEHTYTVCFSLPTDKHNATGFGGKVHGVATLIRNDTLPRVSVTRTPSWSLEGRLLIHEMRNGIVVINGYWVNGTSNPYRDPTTGSIKGTRHDYKLQFHHQVLNEVLHLQAHGRHVILVGDMNVARSRLDGHPNLRTSPVQHVKNRADFNDKFFDSPSGMRGIDVFRHIKGQQRKYTYHGRGRPWGQSCDRVDLIIVSGTLVDAIVDTDICDTPLDRGHSDHVPLWLAIDESQIKGGGGSHPAKAVHSEEEGTGKLK